MLHLISETRHTKDISTLVVDDMHNLITKFAGIYGNPTMYFKMPDAKALEPYRVGWYYKWKFNNKQILIGIARLKDDNTYFRDNRNYVSVCEIKNIKLDSIANTQLIYTDFDYIPQ